MTQENDHHRRSIRLKDYDYTQAGAYFVTLVTYARECMFGEIGADGVLMLNPLGEIAREEWGKSTGIRREIALDEFIIMPNHVHGIVLMLGHDTVGAHGRAPLPNPFHRPPKSLGAFVAGFKSATTKRLNQTRATPGAPVWQRNYYDHIVRDEGDLARLRTYIQDNSAQWALDQFHPAAPPNRFDLDHP